MSHTHKQTKKQGKKAAARREKAKQAKARKIVARKVAREQAPDDAEPAPRARSEASTSWTRAASKAAGPPPSKVRPA